MQRLMVLFACLFMLVSACTSVQVTSTRRPVTIERITPMLILVHQGDFGRKHAAELADELEREVHARHVAAKVWVVGPRELEDDALLANAHRNKATALRVFPARGEKLSGKMVPLTYHLTLQDLSDDTLLWQGWLSLKSGVNAQQVERRQRRAAHVLLDKLERDGVLRDP